MTDPAGDGRKGRNLDITSIRVNNGDHAIAAIISVVRVTGGDFGVRYRARGDDRRQMALVYSEGSPGNHTDGLETPEGAQSCKGLRVSWDREASILKVRLPSKCFDSGDYGAVHVKVITEIGSDADLAPKGPAGGWIWTPWTSRG